MSVKIRKREEQKIVKKRKVKLIKEIILENRTKTQSDLAKILNEKDIGTIYGRNWTQSLVSHFMKYEMGINRCSPYTKTKKENNLDGTPDMLRFQENILNQLEKAEPEIIPNYEIKDIVFIKDGKFCTDSLMIASTFERKHFNILELIKNLDCSKEFRDLNFQVSSYTNLQNKEFIKFVLTRDGFSMIAMGLTGSKAVQFKEMYINQFNQMEQALKEQYSKPIQKELSAMELMAITLKGFQEQETKVLFEIKKESESIKHETNKALESQRKEFDIKIQELNNRVSTIPMIKEKVYTQTPFSFPSSGLKDTETTFKHKDSTLLEQREDLREDISRLIRELAGTKKVTMHNAWSIAYALLYKQLEVGFYDEFVQINDNRNPSDKLAKIDYVLSKDMGKTLLLCIKRLLNK